MRVGYGNLKRIARAVRLLARDGSCRAGSAALLRRAGAAPGAVRRLVLLVVAAILWLGYRERLRAAWRAAA